MGSALNTRDVPELYVCLYNRVGVDHDRGSPTLDDHEATNGRTASVNVWRRDAHEIAPGLQRLGRLAGFRLVVVNEEW